MEFEKQIQQQNQNQSKLEYDYQQKIQQKQQKKIMQKRENDFLINGKNKIDPKRIMVYKEEIGLYTAKKNMDQFENMQETLKIQQNKIDKNTENQNNSQDFVNLSDHLRQEELENQQQQQQKAIQQQKLKKIQINSNNNAPVTEKIQEIFQILKQSKLQFQKEQSINNNQNYKDDQNIQRELEEVLKEKNKYKITTLDHKKPFIRQVASGKCFQESKLLLTDEIDGKIKDMQTLESSQKFDKRARSASPKLKRAGEQNLKQTWKPGNYYPRLFRQETLLANSEWKLNQKNLKKDNIEIDKLDDEYLKKIDENNKFLHLDEMEYNCVETRAQTVKNNGIYKSSNGNSMKSTGKNFFYDTDSFAKKKEEKMQQKHEIYFKEQQKITSEPFKLGGQQKYFNEKTFIPYKAEQKGRSLSPNPQKERESGWRHAPYVPLTFEEIMEKNKNRVHKVRRTAYPKVIDEKGKSPKKQYPITQNKENQKQFYYKPAYKDLHNKKFQNKFEQQMLNSFE